MKVKGPFIPREEHSTVRQAIMTLLEQHTLSAREISAAVRIPEKEVLDHLEHIRAATHKSGQQLLLTPAACKKCGFAFRKRERLTRPGKCPVCRSEQIAEPLYGIMKRD
jgi:predicted Zn-ribbon and HTH transcriptional regulator